MDDIQRGIVMLIRSAITGEAYQLPEGFDIEKAYPQIEQHSIHMLAYVGAVTNGIPRNHPTMGILFQKYCRGMMISERQMRSVEKICAAFDENGIDYMPLKGCNMKALYPKPEMRAMGDADILIRMEQYDRIVPIMQKLQFELHHESGHEIVWNSEDLLLELHKRIVSPYNDDYCAYFGDGWRLAKPVSGTRYAMSKEDEFIYLFTHFAGHYRNGGIGCRHLTDLWVYLRKCGEMDEAYIDSELKKLQLSDFCRNIRRLISAWFEDGESDKISEFAGDFIFNSGNWGNMESHAVSSELKKMSDSGSKDYSKVKSIFRAIFPCADAIKYIYPILQKAPFLLPVIWPVRWVDVLLFRRKNIRSRMNAIDSVTEEKISSHQQALDYVGLSFRFDE